VPYGIKMPNVEVTGAALLHKLSEAGDVFGKKNRVVDKFLVTLVAKHDCRGKLR